MSGCAPFTTASILARRVSEALVVVLGLAAVATEARAELVVLTDGAHFKVASYEVVDETMSLALLGGGRMTLALERVERVVEDEVVPRPASPPLPAAFAFGFSEDHARPATPFAEPIYESARRHGLNPSLVAAVVRTESSFDPRAVSRKGARGLMQLMPATGRRLGVAPAELYEPEKNLDAGSRYLRQLLDRFGALELALAAYNAGEGAVERHGGVPPYRETVEYVKKVYAVLGIDGAAAPAAVDAESARVTGRGR